MNKLPAMPLFMPDGEQAFHRALNIQAQAYLKDHGDHRYADGVSLVKALALSLWCVAGYIICLTQHTGWGFFGGYLLFVLMGMLLNVNVNHDASHNVFLRSTRANRIISRLVTLPLGVDPDYWRVRHVEFHHRYANVEHYDLDTQENGIFRQSPYQQHRPHMRFQHLYWPLIAALSLPYIAWIFDWSDRMGKTPLKLTDALPGRRGWVIFAGFKLLHLLLVLVVPLFVAHAHGIGTGVVIASYLVSQMIASTFVVFLLLGTHWAQAEFYEAPAAGKMPQGWYKHNFATACDWHPSPLWLEKWFGMLNLHLTHHLFPGWHHRHYPALAKIIAALAAEHGLNYRCIGYRQLLREQQDFLRKMGNGEDLRTAGSSGPWSQK